MGARTEQYLLIIMSASEGVAKLPKPQLRGLLNRQIRVNLILTGFSCLAAGLYMRFVYGDGQKRKYAEFYK